MNSSLCKTLIASKCNVSLLQMAHGAIHKSWSSETDLLVVLSPVMQRNRLLG